MSEPSDLHNERSTTTLPYLLTPKAMFRLGLALVVGAVAYFLRYSFEQGWIGDHAKVGMATGIGLAMIVTGIQIAQRRPAHGNSLQGGGSAVLYLTAFATHQRYGLTDDTGAFLMLAAVSAAVIAMALRQRSEPLAIAGVVGALFAPLVIGGRIDVFPGDAGYQVAVLIVGAFLYLRRRWMWQFAVALTGVSAVIALELVTVMLGGGERPAELQVAITGLWVLGWGASLLGAVRRPSDATIGATIPVLVTVTIPLVALVATLVNWSVGSGTIGWAAVTFGVAASHVAAFLVLRPRALSVASVQLVPAAVATTLGLVGSLEGSMIVLAMALQAASMILTGVRYRLPVLADIGHLMAGFTGLAWIALIAAGSGTGFDGGDIVSGVVVLIAAMVSLALRNADRPHDALGQAYGALSLPAAMVWAIAALGDLPNGAGLVTGTWAAIGFGMLIWGRLSDLGLVRNVGIGVVLVAVAKLLVIDSAAAEPLMRIGLFAGIGIALLAVGYWLASDDEHDHADAGDQLDEAMPSETAPR